MPMYASTFSPAEPDPIPLTPVPEVQSALDHLLEANDRWRAAVDRERTARAAAEQAPQQDASAAIEAVASGAKLPPVTEIKAKAQYEEATRVRVAAEALALQAEQDLLAAIDAHREALRAAQRDRLEKALDAVDVAVATLEDAMEAAGLEAARLVNVGNEDYGHPLSTPVPMRWDVHDSRLDATTDARAGLSLITEFARNMRPSVIRERELQAVTEWNEVLEGRSARYAQHRTPDGEKVWLRT